MYLLTRGMLHMMQALEDGVLGMSAGLFFPG